MKSSQLGAPKLWTEQQKARILKKLIKYIDEEDIPILAEFAYKNRIYRQRLYEWSKEKNNIGEAFADAIDICLAKKEAQLERGGLSGELNSNIVALSLKQLGWRERHQEENSDQTSLIDMISKLIEKLPS